jgi:acetolactate decarboxylase
MMGVVVFSCSPKADRDTLTQVGTIDALLGGIYDGEFPLSELAKRGDLGVGTFNTLNGEMVVLDGQIYQITADGKVAPAALNGRTPFAAVTCFDADRQINLPAGATFDSLAKAIDAAIPTNNIFYAIKLEGKFKAVKTRSVPAQTRPYRPLKEITATQPVFDLADVEGTIVGFRCPAFVAGVNVPGYHLHFLSADKGAGGHLLAFTTAADAMIKIDETNAFTMILPHDADFYSIDLTADKQADLQKVEK